MKKLFKVFYLLKHIKMLDQNVSNNQIDHG